MVWVGLNKMMGTLVSTIKISITNNNDGQSYVFPRHLSWHREKQVGREEVGLV
jgi:hypothetical protein